jgi:hypothetical protein
MIVSGAGMLPRQHRHNIMGWGPALCACQPDLTMAMGDAFLNKLYAPTLTLFSP